MNWKSIEMRDRQIHENRVTAMQNVVERCLFVFLPKSGLYFLSADSRHMLAEACIHDTTGLTEGNMWKYGGT